MNIVLITQITPTEDNFNGPSALMYHLLLHRASDISVCIFTTNSNQVTDQEIDSIARKMNAKIEVFSTKKKSRFSIIFHKQFAVIGNEERGMARFNSLLSLFGLENRLVTSSQQILSLPLIDFDSIDEKLSTLRTESLNFLIEALGSK